MDFSETLIPSTPQNKAASLEYPIPDDVLFQYFDATISPLAAAPTSPVDENLALIEVKLENEVPTDEAAIMELRLALSKAV